jgi:hypothetical protein
VDSILDEWRKRNPNFWVLDCKEEEEEDGSSVLDMKKKGGNW